MTSPLPTVATQLADLTPSQLLTLAVAGFLAWRLMLIVVFPWGPCPGCHGAARHRRGKYWRPCRRCQGTGRRLRLGRRVWNWATGTR